MKEKRVIHVYIAREEERRQPNYVWLGWMKVNIDYGASDKTSELSD